MLSSLETLPRVLLSPVCSSLNYLTSLVTTFPECQTFLPVLCSRIYTSSEIRSNCSHSFLRMNLYECISISFAFYLPFSQKISYFYNYHLFRISYKLISRHSYWILFEIIRRIVYKFGTRRVEVSSDDRFYDRTWRIALSTRELRNLGARL